MEIHVSFRIRQDQMWGQWIHDLSLIHSDPILDMYEVPSQEEESFPCYEPAI